MSKVPFLPRHPLLLCSPIFQKHGALPRHMGILQPCEGMRHVCGTASIEDEHVTLHLLVDEEDGVLADAKFQAYAHPGLVALCEVVCVDAVRKTYEQLRRYHADFIVTLVEKTGTALPAEMYKYVNLVLDTLFHAVSQCMDIPLQEEITTSPVDFSHLADGELPDYEALSHEERISLIEQVINKDVRPYIELDAGGIEIVALNNSIELVIAYQGACVSCPSSIGGTLDAITKILRAKVHPHLIVSPDASFLEQFSTPSS